MEFRELLVPDEGLFARELPPTEQTCQFHPVSQFSFFLISFLFTVSVCTVGWDQTRLLRRRMLLMSKHSMGE